MTQEIDLANTKELRLPLFVDVRDLSERHNGYYPGLHIPLGELNKRHLEIDTCRPVVFYCARGRRSWQAARWLQQMYPGAKVYSLKGGFKADITT